MADAAELRTERLLLRRWRRADRAPFAAMNADPEVMRYFPSALTPEDSDTFVDRIEAGFEKNGFGLWALEVVPAGEFIGFTGLAVPGFDAHFTPAVEIGWRLARPFWGQGYALEAALATIEDGFFRLGLDEIVGFTVPANTRSWRVMQRLGMTREPSTDFDHPGIPEGHPMRRHVVYRIRRAGP